MKKRFTRIKKWVRELIGAAKMSIIIKGFKGNKEAANNLAETLIFNRGMFPGMTRSNIREFLANADQMKFSVNDKEAVEVLVIALKKVLVRITLTKAGIPRKRTPKNIHDWIIAAIKACEKKKFSIPCKNSGDVPNITEKHLVGLTPQERELVKVYYDGKYAIIEITGFREESEPGR